MQPAPSRKPKGSKRATFQTNHTEFSKEITNMVRTYSIYVHQELMGYLNSFTANNEFPMSYFDLHQISNQLEIFEKQMENTTHLATKHLPIILQNPSYAKIRNTTFAKFQIPIVNDEIFTRHELARKSYFRQYPKGK